MEDPLPSGVDVGVNLDKRQLAMQETLPKRLTAGNRNIIMTGDSCPQLSCDIIILSFDGHSALGLSDKPNSFQIRTR